MISTSSVIRMIERLSLLTDVPAPLDFPWAQVQEQSRPGIDQGDLHPDHSHHRHPCSPSDADDPYERRSCQRVNPYPPERDLSFRGTGTRRAKKREILALARMGMKVEKHKGRLTGTQAKLTAMKKR